MKNFVQATLALEDKMYLLTDEKSLFELQKAFSSSQEIRGGAGCPFTADLCFKTKEGKMINKKMWEMKKSLPKRGAIIIT